MRLPGLWLWVGGPVAPGAAATTIGPIVLIRRGHEHDARLVRHEAEHVRQYRDHGIAGFLVRYLAEYVRWRLRRHPHWDAYRRISFEIEAEWISRRWARSQPSVRGAGATGTAGRPGQGGPSPP